MFYMAPQLDVAKKLKQIEQELHSLKSIVFKQSYAKKHAKVAKLEGFFTGMSVSEKDIEISKKSLFKHDV